MGRLENKVAIITGGNSGIGACAAKLFAKEGAKVVISARRTAQLEEIADEIKKAGGEVLAVSCDISDSEQCKTVVEKAIAQFGTVDILVNNAGIVDNDIKAIEKISDETIDSLININTKGTLYMAREASKIFMEKKSGCIVNVASVAGYYGCGGAAYATSKAAMIGLTKNIAMRGASIGVRCNALCPGTVVTPMTANMKRENLDPDMMGSMAKHADLSLPPCMPEEVANAILFLASDESSAVTGQIIVIDHGADL
ncbi:MAG: SDR family oxidoreductase [Lachnospiraceae bacterium]|jgi:NAD(P)-dependent dehydrogenase (short-subunit alcohol dehydrogenase family)|nr:SDR family oxidoreductase [Lachnospiraceae bacterium]